MMRQVLVTGAGGFVGRHLVTGLLAQGFRVIAADQRLDDDLAAEWQSQAVETWLGDITHLPDLSVEAVIHGAAITAGAEERAESPLANLRANIDPLLSLLDWAERQPVKRVLVVSSSAVFRGRPTVAFDEASATSPSGLYAAAKSLGEGLVRTLKTDFGRDMATIRFGSVYGPGERVRATRPRLSPVMQLILAALETGTVRVPAHSWRMDWTFAPDIGRAVCGLIQAPELKHDLYNVTSSQPFTLLDIAKVIQRLLPNTRLDIFDEPQKPFRGFMRDTRLRQEIGFDSWTSLEAGLRETIAWVQTQQRRP